MPPAAPLAMPAWQPLAMVQFSKTARPGVHAHPEGAVEGDRRLRHPGRTQHTGQHHQDRAQATATRYRPSTARKPAADAHTHLYSDAKDRRDANRTGGYGVKLATQAGAPHAADQATELRS